MHMTYELFIALRYLRARRRQATVSVLTGIAIAGITVGVASLIVAQALITGFRTEVQEKILEGTAHVNLLRKDNQGITDYRTLVALVKAVPKVRAVSATTYEPVLMTNGDYQELAVLKGVDLDAPREANEVFTITVEGDPSKLNSVDSSGEPTEGVVIGKDLARVLGLRMDNTATVVSAQSRLTPW